MRDVKSRAILVVAMTAVAMIGAACSSGGGSSGNGPAKKGGTVKVALADFSVTPAQSSLASGPITFKVHNAGKEQHELVVIRTDRPAAHLPVKDGEASEKGDLGEVEDVAPGANGSVTLDLPAGHYALICNVPGHYLAGMHAEFTVS